MRNLIESLIKFFYVSMGVIILSAFVGMFTMEGKWNFHLLLQNIKDIYLSLLFIESITIQGPTGFEFSIFPKFWDTYLYTITILITAFLFSILMGILMTYFVVILPVKIKNIIISITSLFESLPDLLIIMAMQFVVLIYYKESGILLFSIAGTSETKTYLLPIIVLSLIPAMMIFNLLLHLVNDEMEKQYVTLAKSKGFSISFIYFFHIIRNLTSSLFNHSKSILFFMLSSLVVFEKLFNIQGLISFIVKYPEPKIIAFSLIMIALPIIVVYTIISFYTEKQTGYRLEW